MVLSAGESHHLATVLRALPGDRFELFDGQGRRAVGRVELADPLAARLTILEELASETPARLGDLTLATAVPKGDRFDWLIEKAVELGVTRVVPMVTARSVVEPRDTKLDRLRTAIVSASKQCGRARLMELSPRMTWLSVLDELVGGTVAVVAHPGGCSLSEVWQGKPLDMSRLALIGPEGGLTEEEVSAAVSAGVIPVSLGNTILRTETAAIAVAAAAALG